MYNFCDTRTVHVQFVNVQFLKSDVHFSEPQKWDVIRGLDAPIMGEDPRMYRLAGIFGVTGAHWLTNAIREAPIAQISVQSVAL